MLKTASKCYPDPTCWSTNFGFVWHGLHSVVKDENLSSAVLIFGQTLRLSGQFFNNYEISLTLSEYRKELIEFMTRLHPRPTRCSRNQKAYLGEKLQTCTHVFERNESPSNKFESSYNGLYAVLEKKTKFFLLKIDHGQIDNVLIDRIKSANLLLATKAEESEQVQTNISGNDFSHSRNNS